jgi:hypothetical protein
MGPTQVRPVWPPDARMSAYFVNPDSESKKETGDSGAVMSTQNKFDSEPIAAIGRYLSFTPSSKLCAYSKMAVRRGDAHETRLIRHAKRTVNSNVLG